MIPESRSQTVANADASADAICELGADRLSRAIHARELSCVEVMRAYLARIDAINPRFNAIVNRRPADELMREAVERDAELAAGRSRGWLHGIPQAIKDVSACRGLPTTAGSPLLKDAVATEDGIAPGRIRAAGAIFVGKTNVPEFGLGSHTFNEVFGATRNAWDPGRSAGGSSGGAAVCLAHRLLPVADGSDFMGSLRNPAGWNHVFGMRPSQGRVPFGPAPEVWLAQLGTEGPMARSVGDLARLLAIQSGPDRRAPLASAPPLALERALTPADPRSLRIAWLGNLGGHLATEAGVLEVCEQALARFAGAGAVVEAIAANFAPDAVWDAWRVWRRALVGARLAPLLALPGGRERIKPEALWEVDQAEGLSFSDFEIASQRRSAFHAALLAIFDRFDLIALPSAQVWPFPVDERWPREIAGRAMDTYHRWMETTIYATFAGAPAISVPAGFDPSGRWPMGLQLIAAPQRDEDLLAAALRYESLAADLLALRPSA